ncbi:MFS transporter [Marinomonas mediterranea]|uniref:Major facilitator superfamily MFS_1 n=1 Tax=Marinomonas mediterranea (strain ATCC 700492 / JCM 21426 / NBRC 103028 / MMB-1) TaxID=717774 RepID=F2JUI0_MARM1|nr:MFS transporter [Marinomonas mediterranea]ADZ89313.1 major facilitator superfamily MFS_1 [Marinomonas mediterranea MMB-1]
MRIFEWKRTVTYCLMFIACGAVSGMLGPCLIYLANRSDSSVAEISVLFTARGIGNILGALVASRMYDRFSGHHYLVAMLVIMISATLLVPFSTALWVLIGLFVLLGASEVSVNTGGNLMMLWLHREKVESYVTALHLSYSLGAMVAPLIFVAMNGLGGSYGWGIWLIGLYSVLFPILLLKQKTPVLETSSSIQSDEPKKQTKLFGAFLFVIFLYVGIEVTVAGWISTYGSLMGMSEDSAVVLATWFFMAMSLGRLIFVPLLRWLALVPCVYALMCVCAVSILGINVSGSSEGMLAMLVFGLGFGCSALFPMIFSFANRILTLTGKRTGIIFFCCGLGALVAPSLTGPLIDAFGVGSFPILLMILFGFFVLSWTYVLKLAKSH